MKFPAKPSMLFLCLGLLLVSGCANFLRPETGAVARPEARIALPEKGVQNKTYTADDLEIVYSLSGASEPFALSGTIVFDRSLTDSFPIVTRFMLKMSFLDGQGRVIETIDITPVFGYFTRMPDKLDFRVSRPVPTGSKAIAFNYFGEFRSSITKSGGSWEIYSFPYD